MDYMEWIEEEEATVDDCYIENIELTEEPSSHLKNSVSGVSLSSVLSNVSKLSSGIPSLAQDSATMDSQSQHSPPEDDDSLLLKKTHHPTLRRRSRGSSKSPTPSFDDSSVQELNPLHITHATWLIPANHKGKILWDMLTVVLSFISLYLTHQSIRDRRYERDNFRTFCDAWFFVDIVLNFFTEHRISNGQVIRDGKAIWARYLTTWFIVDALSLCPWERVFVKPIIDMQNKRGPLRKFFFRSRRVVGVVRKLRKNHFRLFGRVVKQTKPLGVRSFKLLRLIIRYVPKYFVFLKNMRGVLAVRFLRQVHWLRKLFKNLYLSSTSSAQKIQNIVSVEHFSTLVDSSTVVTFLTPPRNVRRYQSLESTNTTQRKIIYHIEEEREFDYE